MHLSLPASSLPSRASRQQFVLAVCLAAIVGAALVLANSPLTVIEALVGLFGFVVLVRRPMLGLYLTVLVIPIERLGRFTSDASMMTMSLMRVIGSAALLALIVHKLSRKQLEFRFDTSFWVYLLFTVLGFATIGYSSDGLGTVRACGAVAGNLLFFFLIMNLITSRKFADQAIVLWLVVTIIMGVYTIAEWHYGTVNVGEESIGQVENRFSTVFEDHSEWAELSGVRRAMGPTSHPAVYAINLIMTLPWFPYLIGRPGNRLFKVFLSLGWIIVIYNIFLTNTRAAIIVAAAVLLLSLAGGLARLKTGHVAAIILAIVCLLPLLPSSIYDRMLNLRNYTSDRSATLSIRLQYWQAAVEIIRDHWLGGIGAGNEVEIPKYLPVDAPERTTCHNSYLYAVMQVGVLGGAVFFFFLGLLYYYAVKAARQFKRQGRHLDYRFMMAAQITMMAVLVYGIQVDVFNFPLKGWWLVAALSVLMWHESRQPAAPETDPLPRMEEPAHA
jgi:hypothetical protein